MDANALELRAPKSMKAARIYMHTAHLPRVNTIRDDHMVELAEFLGATCWKDFLNLN